MKIIFRTILVLSAYAIIPGCAGTDVIHPPIPHTSQSSRLNHSGHVNTLGAVMTYYNSLDEKKAHQLAEEHNYAKNYLADSSNAEGRLKYILFLSTPNTAYTNIQTALDLLKNWPQEALLSPNLASFRKLLIILLTEQQAAENRARNLRQQLRISEENTQTLQKRINAIKNMEITPLRRIDP